MNIRTYTIHMLVILKKIMGMMLQSTHEVAQVILKTIEMKEPPIRTRTSDWSETFTNIKIKLDPDGKQQQKQVYKLLGK